MGCVGGLHVYPVIVNHSSRWMDGWMDGWMDVAFVFVSHLPPVWRRARVECVGCERCMER